MEEEVDSCAFLERKLGIFGYELFDLGEDFGSPEHIYYIFSPEAGSHVTGRLLRLEEVKQLLKQLEFKLEA